jgi:hypothetical protein
MKTRILRKILTPAGIFIFVLTVSALWFSFSAVANGGSQGTLNSSASILVLDAYNIDRKIDDGLPTTGVVQAVYINGSRTVTSAANAQATDSTTSCYNTTSNTYSLSTVANYGAGGNCALSFRFQ